MDDARHLWPGPFVRFVAVLAFTAAVGSLLAVAAPAEATPMRVAVAAVGDVSTSGLPGVGGDIHRGSTRVEHMIRRFGWLLSQVVLLWLQIALSIIVFLFAAAVASVVDVRMLGLRRQGLSAMGRYLADGTRTFFRVLRDRRTPYIARGLMAAALVYWLVPLDLIDDNVMVVGFLDDLVIAVAAGKGFIYLCPDSLIGAHAAAVQARAQA